MSPLHWFTNVFKTFKKTHKTPRRKTVVVGHAGKGRQMVVQRLAQRYDDDKPAPALALSSAMIRWSVIGITPWLGSSLARLARPVVAKRSARGSRRD